MALRFTVEGNPQSKGRPRFKPGSRTYTPKVTVEAEKAVTAAFQEAYPDWQVERDASFTIEMQFFSKDFIRRDLDNLAKLVMDALNGVAWGDDAQIVAMQATVIRGSETPKTLVTIRSTAIPWRRV